MQLNSTNPQHVPATEKAPAVLHHFLWLLSHIHPQANQANYLSLFRTIQTVLYLKDLLQIHISGKTKSHIEY